MRSFILSTFVAFANSDDWWKDLYTLNGANWPDLCQTGREQSPIDISEVTINENLALELSGYYDYPTGEMVDLGATLQFYMGVPGKDWGPKMILTRADGEKIEYWPWQFDFHAPSEHTVGGQHMDLEILFYHLPPRGLTGPFEAAVLSVFF